MSYRSADNNYVSYESTIYSQVSQPKESWNFLQNDHAMGIFGVGKEFGKMYDKAIMENFQDRLSDLASLSGKEEIKTLNTLGNPEKINSFLFNEISPNNLRYCYHALTVLEDISRKNEGKPVHILEIGAGYGGLAVWLHLLSPYFKVQIKKYTTCDLPGPTLLQKKYTKEFSVEIEALHTNFKGWQPEEDCYVYCISCYGFAELSEYYQRLYTENLISKVRGGFMVWNNWTGIYPFAEGIVSMPETPMLPNCPNKFLYW